MILIILVVDEVVDDEIDDLHLDEVAVDEAAVDEVVEVDDEAGKKSDFFK
jgi:hypothetical protein